MSNFLISYRYSLFTLFLVFNAVLCSVAVWNYTIAKVLLLTAHVDVYLAAIGGLAVLFIIPVTFVDMFRKNALTGRVWFELVWVGVFWVLELCGASAFTAINSDTMCSKNAVAIQRDSCTSTRAVQAFSWLITIMLLVYLVILFISALLHYDDDKAVWSSGVRHYPWFNASRAPLGSTPPSPNESVTKWHRKSLMLTKPQPKRPSRSADFAYLEAGSAPSMQQTTRIAVTALAPEPSLYPATVAANMLPARAPPTRVPPPLAFPSRQARRPQGSQLLSIPSPIPEVSPGYIESQRTPQTPGSGSRPLQLHARSGSSGSPTRRGPPPPLDLTKISAYIAIEERRKQVR
ncbi:hypothetical protein EUX98_g7244 [Antrodiella citrinella]|uniref:MARVEL domain-containing protein n=1 Tax=Antrodiella citrinella TaxID=2447956 RepID=A0A4S4MPF9_9APHY|nr:hypothetical protein EUX98_g7244 [Antrodiella citrinella]